MRFGLRQVIAAAVTIMLATAIGMGRRAVAQGGPAAAPAKPMMVEDVFKNVQALKGIGVDDFLLTMGIMSAAVGSDCVGCHPSAGTDHVDWALDTPRKRTARRMVQMVTALNRDNFNGRQIVTCWTCHRGRDRPVITPTLDVVYGPPTDEADDVAGHVAIGRDDGIELGPVEKVVVDGVGYFGAEIELVWKAIVEAAA